jgi:FkbM family methyltransferase
MRNFFRRVQLLARGIRIFKDWNIWLAERFGINRRTGLGTFRLRNGITFAIDYSTSLVGTFNEVWLMDFYEKHHRIQRGETVIDIGAHIGIFAVLAASKGATVYAYEPTPGSYELLCRNTARWPVVHAFPLAVADTTGTVSFVETAGPASSGNMVVYTAPSQATPSHSFTAKSTTLAEIFSENHIEQCDLLKVDCEGAEVEIFKNVPDGVCQKIKNIAMEYHHNLPEMRKILEAKGFKIVESDATDIGYIWLTRV